MAEDGVVGCVESASEGGCEVDGVSVSISEGAATVDACDSSAPSVGVCTCSSICSGFACSSGSAACSRAGNAKPSSLARTGALLRFFFCDALGGNSTSGTDSQGSGGWKGLRSGEGCLGGADAAAEDLEGVLDGGRVAEVMLVEGVGESTGGIDAIDGDEGAGWGV